ncbi:MAG: TIGR00159 family protein [Deltaproteobacteria bacterium]|nr:TIGR00159 family protein [Deltaproteobacteria bacterium]
MVKIAPFAEGTTGIVLAALDLLIVWYLVYRVLLLLKGTRAMPMLAGLALLVVGYVVSRYMQLMTLNWILENFFSSFLILIIIIFQHDIRRGLARVGRRSLFWGQSSREDAAVIEEVMKAAVNLAQKKIGALIVLEREGDLTDYCGEGVIVDAKVTKEVLASIFLPYSPIHDGAVMIQKGRITTAGALLPLTNNPRIAKDLGTRHRAGIGLSEETDAAIVIVSEERGQISLALDGKITRDLDGATLRKVLQSLFRKRRL